MHILHGDLTIIQMHRTNTHKNQFKQYRYRFSVFIFHSFPLALPLCLSSVSVHNSIVTETKINELRVILSSLTNYYHEHMNTSIVIYSNMKWLGFECHTDYKIFFTISCTGIATYRSAFACVANRKRERKREIDRGRNREGEREREYEIYKYTRITGNERKNRP